jgi:hypothetical protein
MRPSLNAQLPKKWMGRGGPIFWPPQSTDLSSLNYFLGGYVKDELLLETDVTTTVESNNTGR